MAIVKSGDLWTIGNHRLLCGDCTNADHVSYLMQNNRATLCFTSPPYGQQRDYTQKIIDWDRLMQGMASHLPLTHDGQLLVNLGLIHRKHEYQPYWDNWIEWLRTE